MERVRFAKAREVHIGRIGIALYNDRARFAFASTFPPARTDVCAQVLLSFLSHESLFRMLVYNLMMNWPAV